MDSFITELAKQAPYLATVVIIVILFLRSLEKRDELWQSFLSDQRCQTTDALGRLSGEINANTAAIIHLQKQAGEHDAWMREATDQQRKRTKQRNGGANE